MSRALSPASRSGFGNYRAIFDVRYSSSGQKIPGLPNNRTNEMIGGCEIRSISSQYPPPRPFYDDAVERRLVMYGF